MSLEDDLKLERYKVVTDRQKYFTDLAKESFTYYTKVFVWLAAGAIALFSLKEKLDIGAEVFSGFLNVIAILLTLLGSASIAQILFCLKRWYGFRNAEHEINPACPKAEGWAWLFEGMYIVAIVITVIAAWYGVGYFQNIL